MKAHSPAFHGRFVALFSTIMPSPALVKPTRRSKSVRFPLPTIRSAQASQSHQSRSQNLANISKGKKHITGVPLKRDMSLGSGDSPKHIGKKLPPKSLKRKGSDVYISSPQDEDIPPIPTSKRDTLTGEKEEISHPISPIQEEEGSMPALQPTPKDPINLGEGMSKDTKKLDEDNLAFKELMARYHTIAADVSSIQTLVSNIQRTQLVAMQLANENNKILKMILTSLVALSTPTATSNPAKVTIDATKKGESNIAWCFFNQEKKTIFIQRENGQVENLKEYDSHSSRSPKIFTTQDRKLILQNDLENSEISEAQEMQSRIRNILKEALKKKIEALDRHEKT
ncbi:hypothetical protein L1987_42392 [Smallanthus sonchifolius]|uniref:Uncharacterized protein n=1 Tax=Smallanthus sonchifolius TaxID=185202 RepID=A0ACB9GIH2_9ASTR|nr:hypothetical protein L1987_42392 [Smallanthus sonchifolius]